MSVMIYDATSKAFKEAETPKIYSSSDQAWVETTGMSWNTEAQTWEERWGKKLFLYNYGDECTDITGGWVHRDRDYNSYTPIQTSGIKNTDNIEIIGDTRTQCSLETSNTIDLTNFSKLFYDVWGQSEDNGGMNLRKADGTFVRLIDDQTVISGRDIYEHDITSFNGEYIVHMAAWSYPTSHAKYYRVWLEK